MPNKFSLSKTATDGLYQNLKGPRPDRLLLTSPSLHLDCKVTTSRDTCPPYLFTEAQSETDLGQERSVNFE